MKTLIKYAIYSIIMVTIVVTSLSIFRNHPEAQFVFIFPGIFLVVFSEIMDNAFRKVSNRMRVFRRK
jgi:hypothetical protein